MPTMRREDQLKFCKQCINRSFDQQQGISCGLTGKIAAFEDTCETYKADEQVKLVPSYSEAGEVIVATGLPNALKDKLRVHQDVSYALIGGAFVSLICALLWAAITVATEYQIGYMAIAVGFLVGISTRFLGAGIDPIYGFIGAFYALLGCLLGNLFSQIGFIAHSQSMEYLDVLTFLSPGLIVSLLTESFSPMDIFFYGFAIFAGYKYAFRTIHPEMLQPGGDSEILLKPSFSSYRLPSVFGSAVLLSIIGFSLSQSANGVKTFYHENGNRMSEGNYVDGTEDGSWVYWNEDGSLNSQGYFKEGKLDSIWQWYDEKSNLAKVNNYKNGLLNGVSYNYYSNGVFSDSGSYLNGRSDGLWVFQYENGAISSKGSFIRDYAHGEWEYYLPDGQLSSKGRYIEGEFAGLWTIYFGNGSRMEEIEHENKKFKVLNSWDMNGNSEVSNGFGQYHAYSESGKIMETGSVENGSKTGLWIRYFENGGKREEGLYDNDVFNVQNAWNTDGTLEVKNGNGIYASYYDDGSVFETGKIENGLRVGDWVAYHEAVGEIYQESAYNEGKLEGKMALYFLNGQVLSTGQMVNNKKEGEWLWYFENGVLECSVSFENDKKIGKQVFYDEFGEQIKEEYYRDGEFVEEKLTAL